MLLFFQRKETTSKNKAGGGFTSPHSLLQCNDLDLNLKCLFSPDIPYDETAAISHLFDLLQGGGEVKGVDLPVDVHVTGGVEMAITGEEVGVVQENK